VTDPSLIETNVRPPGSALVDRLRRDILNGKFESGAPLRQDVLASIHGVSKIPVREALLRLVAEGLVIMEPNRGFMVASLAAEEADELFDIRAVLECHVIRLAIPKITDADIARACAILDQAERSAEVSEWSALNWQFHDALYSVTERSRLLGVIRQTSNPTDSYIRLLLSNANYRGQAEKEHRAILAACNVRNADAAAALVDQHIRQTGVLLKEFLSGQKEK
jgi:DNA-binding GntR family transcriptional regulator